MSSKRNRYRAPQRRRFLTVTLHAPCGNKADATVDDLSGFGAGAVFSPADVPSLSAGDPVELEFHALVLLQPLRVAATVRRVEEHGDECRIGFEFVDPDAVMKHVPYVLLREFNRRLAPRLAVEGTVELTVQDSNDGRPKEVLAVLVDVSLGGIGVRANPRQGHFMEAGQQVEARFSLPDLEREFVLVGFVRDLRSDMEELLVSIEFDDKLTHGFSVQSAIIDKYVADNLEDVPSRREQ